MTAAQRTGRRTGSDLLASLRPIGLDELRERAGLLTRVDRKYVLPLTDLEAFVAGIGADAVVLEIDGEREFGYRSAYYDTPGLSSYLSAAHRRRRRFKVRVRSYTDSGIHFLEVKTRGARGATVKERVPYDGAQDWLSAQDRDLAGRMLELSGVTCDTSDLRLALTTAYRRTTFYLPGSGSRVTVDTDLRWWLPDGTGFDRDAMAVVETKSSGAAGAADRVLWELHHRPRPVSKYASGLAVLRRDLPAHRWQPVLRRHFDVPTTISQGAPS